MDRWEILTHRFGGRLWTTFSIASPSRKRWVAGISRRGSRTVPIIRGRKAFAIESAILKKD